MSRRFEVFCTRIAEQDLAGIINYIARDDADTAAAALSSFQEQAASLVYFPKRGEKFPNSNDTH